MKLIFKLSKPHYRNRKERNMIQAKELRIGNLYKGASRGNIEAATGQTIAQIEEGKLNALPIELQPEILEAAGFKYFHLDKDGGCTDPRDAYWISGILSISNLTWHIHSPYSLSIQYVHQLQNLYHALTGSDLKIELPTTGKE